MSYEITVDESQKFIIITTYGELTNQIAMEQNLKAHKLGEKLGIDRYLVDVTNSRYNGPTIAHYQFAYEEMQAEPGINPSAKVAALVGPGDHSHDFFETVSRNNGMDFTLFRNREQAIRYLLRK